METRAGPTSLLATERSDAAVLLVDDQETFRNVLSAVIDRAEGFTVVGRAASGEEATHAVAALSPELVIMDVMMPGMDGVAAARSILNRSHPPVVVLTSVDNHSLCAAADELGDEVICVRKQDLLPQRLVALWENATADR